MNGIEVRLLKPGDEAVVERLATREPRTALLQDPRTIFLVAFDGGSPIGFVLAYALPRRHGPSVTLCVYEVDVNAAHRAAGHRRRGCSASSRRSHESAASRRASC